MMQFLTGFHNPSSIPRCIHILVAESQNTVKKVFDMDIDLDCALDPTNLGQVLETHPVYSFEELTELYLLVYYTHRITVWLCRKYANIDVIEKTSIF